MTEKHSYPSQDLSKIMFPASTPTAHLDRYITVARTSRLLHATSVKPKAASSTRCHGTVERLVLSTTMSVSSRGSKKKPPKPWSSKVRRDVPNAALQSTRPVVVTTWHVRQTFIVMMEQANTVGRQALQGRVLLQMWCHLSRDSKRWQRGP